MANDCQQAQFWSQRYQEARTPWDRGQAAPAFVALLAAADAPPPGRAIALGCGRGCDALLFAEGGFAVTGVDFAPEAIAEAQALASERGATVDFQTRDLFNLPASWRGEFDYVIEHTCFCAIDPSQRDRYVQVARELLKPNGELLGVFFTHGRPGGPPFGVQPEEIRAAFAPAFQIDRLEPLPAAAALRPEEEHLGRFRRR